MESIRKSMLKLKPAEKNRSPLSLLLKIRRGWLVLITIVLALLLWEGLVHLEIKADRYHGLFLCAG